MAVLSSDENPTRRNLINAMNVRISNHSFRGLKILNCNITRWMNELKHVLIIEV